MVIGQILGIRERPLYRRGLLGIPVDVPDAVLLAFQQSRVASLVGIDIWASFIAISLATTVSSTISCALSSDSASAVDMFFDMRSPW